MERGKGAHERAQGWAHASEAAPRIRKTHRISNHWAGISFPRTGFPPTAWRKRTPHHTTPPSQAPSSSSKERDRTPPRSANLTERRHPARAQKKIRLDNERYLAQHPEIAMIMSVVVSEVKCYAHHPPPLPPSHSISVPLFPLSSPFPPSPSVSACPSPLHPSSPYIPTPGPTQDPFGCGTFSVHGRKGSLHLRINETGAWTDMRACHPK